jgi:hypothetical protein
VPSEDAIGKDPLHQLLSDAVDLHFLYLFSIVQSVYSHSLQDMFSVMPFAAKLCGHRRELRRILRTKKVEAKTCGPPNGRNQRMISGTYQKE